MVVAAGRLTACVILFTIHWIAVAYLHLHEITAWILGLLAFLLFEYFIVGRLYLRKIARGNKDDRSTSP